MYPIKIYSLHMLKTMANLPEHVRLGILFDKAAAKQKGGDKFWANVDPQAALYVDEGVRAQHANTRQFIRELGITTPTTLNLGYVKADTNAAKKTVKNAEEAAKNTEAAQKYLQEGQKGHRKTRRRTKRRRTSVIIKRKRTLHRRSHYKRLRRSRRQTRRLSRK